MFFVCSAKQLVRGEPNVSYICSRYYRAPELIFGATDYTSSIGRLTPALNTFNPFIECYVVVADKTHIDKQKRMVTCLFSCRRVVSWLRIGGAVARATNLSG